MEAKSTHRRPVFTIGMKLLSGVLLCFLLLAAFGSYLGSVMNQVTQSYESLTGRYTVLREIVALRSLSELSQSAIHSYVQTGDQDWVATYNSHAREFDTRLANLGEETYILENDESFQDLQESFSLVRANEERIVESVLAGNSAGAQRLFSNEYQGQVEDFFTVLERLESRTNEMALNIVQRNRLLIVISINVLVVVFVILMVGITGVSILASYALTKSIRSLKESAEAMMNGDFSKRVEVRTRDEIGELGDAFNIMANKLQESYRGLENKVAEKTVQLQQSLAELKIERNRLTREIAKDDAILASIGDGMVVTDPQGRVVFLNEQAKYLLQLPEGVHEGKLFNELAKAIDENGDEIPWEQWPLMLACKMRKKVASSEYGYKLQGGTIIAVATTATPITVGKQVHGMVNVFRDITHEKNVNRAKTEFVSLASHQLRTPLTAIRWNAEMLIDDPAKMDSSQVSMISDLHKSCEHMIALVDALLNISRIELGTFTIVPKKIDLRKIADEILDEFSVIIRGKQVEVKRTVPSRLSPVPVDEDLTRILFQNLISNAVKYTPENGRVEIEFERVGDEIVFTVRDTGQGIPAGDQPHIFEKMFRSKNVGEIQGNGLGLYMVRQIAEASGCRVDFESKEGEGSAFHVYIPLTGMRPKAGSKKLKVSKFGEDSASNPYVI